jgi:hypothetical protein
MECGGAPVRPHLYVASSRPRRAGLRSEACRHDDVDDDLADSASRSSQHGPASAAGIITRRIVSASASGSAIADGRALDAVLRAARASKEVGATEPGARIARSVQARAAEAPTRLGRHADISAR